MKVVAAIVRKVNNNEITNSKDVRKLRTVLRDPVAKEEFLSERGTIERALLKVPAEPSKKVGLASDLDELASAIRRYLASLPCHRIQQPIIYTNVSAK